MSPKSAIKFHQEGRKLLCVQVRCLQETDRETHLVLEVTQPEMGHLKRSEKVQITQMLQGKEWKVPASVWVIVRMLNPYIPSCHVCLDPTC